MKGKRDRALLALLLACGIRRHELASLTVDHLQQRERHWAIVELARKTWFMAFWMTGQGPPDLARAAFSGG
jgi:site-specific recombinase XerD